MPPPDRILETVLYVGDLAAAEAFYRDVLGMQPFSKAAGRHMFYRCGDQVLLLFDPAATEQPPRDPRPSIYTPRHHPLCAVLAFVQEARTCPGVVRMALVGSLATEKPNPKDADVLVPVDDPMELAPLALAGRRLKGQCQSINLGADIFLADQAGRYIGRICHYRSCHRRVACRAQGCGRRQHHNDDLHVVSLDPGLIASPPLVLWPHFVRRGPMPADVEELLLVGLEQ